MTNHMAPTLTQLDNILSAAQRHSNDAYGRYLMEIARTYSLALIAHSLVEIQSSLTSLDALDALGELLSEINSPKEEGSNV